MATLLASSPISLLASLIMLSSFIQGCTRASDVVIRLSGFNVSSLLIISLASSLTSFQWDKGKEYLA